MHPSLVLRVQRNLRNGSCSSVQDQQQFEVSFLSLASAPKLEDLNKVNTLLDQTQIVQNSIFCGYKI